MGFRVRIGRGQPYLLHHFLLLTQFFSFLLSIFETLVRDSIIKNVLLFININCSYIYSIKYQATFVFLDIYIYIYMYVSTNVHFFFIFIKYLGFFFFFLRIIWYDYT